ncbi:MAG: hypothetical protein WAX37_02935 [Minisyncoccia bacterium]
MLLNSQKNKLLFKVIIISIFIAVIVGVVVFSPSSKIAITPANETVYVSNDYGFSFSLPESWKGYSVTVGKWTGNKVDDQMGDVAFTLGPVVSIHNPKWSGGTTYQDIPIMVFTIAQWDDLNADKFHIGAAPINPSELARNFKYILALPARYNYAFPAGYEEVEQILKSNPIKVFAPKSLKF